jgi:hypothetical protein
VTRQDKSKSGRVTPKGTVTTPSDAQKAAGDVGASGVSRTPVNIDGGSSIAVPIVMFGALGIGVLLILVNYLEVLWDARNSVLFSGLGLVLVGIIAATRYR